MELEEARKVLAEYYKMKKKRFNSLRYTMNLKEAREVMVNLDSEGKTAIYNMALAFDNRITELESQLEIK